MLANNEDKNLLRENTRLNFLSSLQTLLLPALLSLQSTLRAFRQAVNGQAVKASVQSFLFAVPCSSLVSYAHRMQFPSGMNLLWSGLIHSPHSLFGAMPAAAWAHPAPTVPWGVHALPSSNCSSLSHCLFLCSLFPLYFCPILNMFSQSCHKLLQMALATGVSIARSGTGQP